MKNAKQIYVVLFLIAVIFSTISCGENSNIKNETTYLESIIPKPQSLKVKEGNFVFKDKIVIATDWKYEKVKKTIEYFSDILSKVSNVDIQLVAKESLTKTPTIIINQNNSDSFGDEAYNLSISNKTITIEASKANGVFYAFQTLLQLLPPQVFSGAKVDIPLKIKCVEVRDNPRFAWRGLLFDVARYFFPKEYIKKQLDYLAMHKMNVYHWHLTDDQGWRIEIKKYPKLTEVSAWRKDTVAYKPWMASLEGLKKANKDDNYGGYYTQEDIKEIVKYAADRFITIIPEIEMPGHCISSFAAYPELSCTGQHYNVSGKGTGHNNRKAYCAGNEEVFTFLENVLTEVMELFPSEYIHIGGDEVNYISWQNCPKCQQRIKKEGLANEDELQSYFIKRIAKFVNSKGRKIIGWDEIMKGGTPQGAAVMAWRENNFGILAARANHKVVYTPDEYFYINEYQGNPLYEPIAYNQLTPLRKVYSFEPIQEDSLTYEETKNIKGVETALWTNFLSSIWLADYMLFPRLSAVAEIAWTKKDLHNWDDFAFRLDKQLERYDYAKIKYARTLYDVTAKFKVNKRDRNLIVTLQNEAGNTQIYYTMDGSEPTLSSLQYRKPFEVTEISNLKAASFRKGKLVSRRITEMKILANKVTGLEVKTKYPVDKRYVANGENSLTDGVTGTTSYSDGTWNGYYGVDFNGVVDLQKMEEISTVSAYFLHYQTGGVFLPENVEILTSSDGKIFKSVAKVETTTPLNDKQNQVKEFSAIFNPVKARFVKIIAHNIGKCPKWHKYAGSDAFLFISEIAVK